VTTLLARLLLAGLLLAGCRRPSHQQSGGSGGEVPADTGTPADVPATPDVGAEADTGGPPDAGEDGGSGETPPARIRIATWNVHRLFDDVCNSGRCEDDDWEEVLSRHELEARAARIAAAITALDADVILLQEVETEAALQAIVDGLDGEVPTVVMGETGGGGSLDVAVIARGPTDSVETHRSRVLRRPDGTETRFSREFLQVRVMLQGRLVVVFDAHFRSKVDDDPGRRLAEARAAAAIVYATAADLPDALVVLGGDLNDTPGSDPLKALETDGELLRVASELTPPNDATYVFWGNPVAIDHLLLAPGDAAEYVAGSARVERDASGGWGGSDHAALRADFLVR